MVNIGYRSFPEEKFMEKLGKIIDRVFRAIPGVRVNPETVIGTCQYCEGPVCHADGDLDLYGLPRHDLCDRRERAERLAEVEHSVILMRGVAIMRELLPLKSRVEGLIEALPDNFDGRDALGFITRCAALVRDTDALKPEDKRLPLEALRLLRRSFFSLAAA